MKIKYIFEERGELCFSDGASIAEIEAIIRKELQMKLDRDLSVIWWRDA